jgi:hypothetical protein
VPAPAVADLLAAYDRQLRSHVPGRLPGDAQVVRDGPVLRFTGFPFGGFVMYQNLGGLEGAALDALIAGQVRAFAERRERFEWKYHGHDRPADLPDRLRSAGFVPEDLETVVIARVASVAWPVVLPDGVTLRTVTERADFDRIQLMEREVWGEEPGSLAEMLEAEHTVDPDALSVVVAEAEADGRVVCAAWIRFEAGTDFGTLWGGATLSAWRGRGIYRATVAHRANLAAARGLRYLEVDASADSRPILERLGFVAVTTTTPYVWTPPG